MSVVKYPSCIVEKTDGGFFEMFYFDPRLSPTETYFHGV